MLHLATVEAFSNEITANFILVAITIQVRMCVYQGSGTWLNRGFLLGPVLPSPDKVHGQAIELVDAETKSKLQRHTFPRRTRPRIRCEEPSESCTHLVYAFTNTAHR